MRRRGYEPSKDSSTETFFTANVRLITFLICMAVFLALAGPWSVFRIRDAVLEYREGKRTSMTVQQVIALSEAAGTPVLSDVDKYRGERSDWDDEIHYTVKIEDEYLLYAVADAATQKITYMTLTHLNCGANESDARTADVFGDDIAAFVRQHNNEKGQ